MINTSFPLFFKTSLKFIFTKLQILPVERRILSTVVQQKSTKGFPRHLIHSRFCGATTDSAFNYSVLYLIFFHLAGRYKDKLEMKLSIEQTTI